MTTAILNRDERGYSIDESLGRIFNKDIALVLAIDARSLFYNVFVIASNGVIGWVPSHDIELVP